MINFLLTIAFLFCSCTKVGRLKNSSAPKTSIINTNKRLSGEQGRAQSEKNQTEISWIKRNFYEFLISDEKNIEEILKSYHELIDKIRETKHKKTKQFFQELEGVSTYLIYYLRTNYNKIKNNLRRNLAVKVINKFNKTLLFSYREGKYYYAHEYFDFFNKIFLSSDNNKDKNILLYLISNYDLHNFFLDNPNKLYEIYKSDIIEKYNSYQIANYQENLIQKIKEFYKYKLQIMGKFGKKKISLIQKFRDKEKTIKKKRGEVMQALGNYRKSTNDTNRINQTKKKIENALIEINDKEKKEKSEIRNWINNLFKQANDEQRRNLYLKETKKVPYIEEPLMDILKELNGEESNLKRDTEEIDSKDESITQKEDKQEDETEEAEENEVRSPDEEKDTKEETDEKDKTVNDEIDENKDETQDKEKDGEEETDEKDRGETDEVDENLEKDDDEKPNIKEMNKRMKSIK